MRPIRPLPWRAGALLALIPILLSAAEPAVSSRGAARLLQQASWGPTPQSIQEVQQLGMSQWIDQQFTIPATKLDIGTPDDKGRYQFRPVQSQFFANTVTSKDQLRQRVAFALSQIWVVSAVKEKFANIMVPYLNLLADDAFANYGQIMYDVTLSPAMGDYLDMANNDKPDPATGRNPDENYAREVLQLFTLGLNKLNPDGSLQLDAKGQPIDTYDQDTIEGFAHAFTGWTYAPRNGAPRRVHNPMNPNAPMVAVETNHDMAGKVLLDGFQLPPAQSAEQDLKMALNNIFQHPNVGPFVSRQLIQHLVTSDPSAAYVARISKVFGDNGKGVRGDMKAVIKAILLDPEARSGDDQVPLSTYGHLREPVLFATHTVRALGGTVEATNTLVDQANNMGQPLFAAPSVFNYFAPDYKIGGTSVNAPEFQIYSTATSMSRVDFINSLIYGTVRGVTVDLSPYVAVANNSDQLLDLISNNILHANMPADMRASIKKAMDAAATPKAKAQSALYLTLSSNTYQVQQ